MIDVSHSQSSRGGGALYIPPPRFLRQSRFPFCSLLTPAEISILSLLPTPAEISILFPSSTVIMSQARSCGICQKSFVHLQALSQHCAAAHAFCCAPCNRKFSSQSALDQHRAHSPKHNPRCPVCRGEYPNVAEHLSTEHPRCIPCFRYFVNDAALQAHHETSSKHVDEFHCCNCGGDFRSMRALDNHGCDFSRQIETVSQVRTVKLANYCEVCERQFGSEKAYGQHMDSVVHKPLCEPLSCKFCERSFGGVSALAHHLESGACAGGMNWKRVNAVVQAVDTTGVVSGADGGQEGFVEEGDLEYEDSDTEDGGARFTPSSSYASRSRAMTPLTPPVSLDVIPLNPLACPLCPRSRRPFVNADALRQHLDSPAHGKKVFHCPVLLGGGQPTKSFAVSSALWQHLEASACKGGRKTFEAALGFMGGRLAEIGFNGVKLIKR